MSRFGAHSDPAHVLVTRTDRMGDMILTAPLFDAVKYHFPRARLSVLASPANAAIAGMLPAIDAVEIDAVEARDSGWRGTVALARRLRQLDIDVILFANAKHRLAVGAWLARIPSRVGHARRGYSVLYTSRVHGSRLEHESDRAVRLLEPLGVRVSAAPTPRCRIIEDDRRTVAQLLTLRGLATAATLAVLHPGNSGNALRAAALWYVQLSDALGAAGYTVVLTGTGAERELTACIAGAARPPVVDLTGQLTVGQLAALLDRSAVCIGSSTGPTHLAAALGTPTLGLYSPLIAQQRWLPRGLAVTVLRPDVGMQCASCLGARCPFFNCMELFAPAQIVAVAKELQARAAR